VSRPPPRPFDPARFAELQRARGTPYGAPFHYSASTASTNDLALDSARAGASSGAVFLADHQTQGRGRRGKTWLAEPNHDLLFSILLRPEREATPPSLTLAVGLGVRAALAPASAEALTVKWPNDVLAGRRKLAGILCEGQFEGKRLSALVIGIGVNIYQAPLPAELEGQVAALEQLGSVETAREREFERERLLVDILEAVERRVTPCVRDGFASLLPEFAQHDALAGERVEVSGPTALVGRARGVDAEGRLLVESEGLVVPVYSGTVRVIGG